MYAAYNINDWYEDVANLTVRATHIATYNCPSDTPSPLLQDPHRVRREGELRRQLGDEHLFRARF